MDFNKDEFIEVLRNRFFENIHRHEGVNWDEIKKRISKDEILMVIYNMDKTGGEPDLLVLNNEYVYIDFSKESPISRRNLCYDEEALEKRKQNKPIGSVEKMAKEIGISILSFEEYQILQNYGDFDTKTSSWLKTPKEIRKLGGAIFGDKRYNTVFMYHNSADSYYSSRGFRGYIKI